LHPDDEIVADEFTWKAKSWGLRLFQTVMVMTLVNGYLAFRYIADKELTLLEFINSLALAICAKVEEEGGKAVAAATRAARKAVIDAHTVQADPGDLPLTLFNGRALGVGGTRGEGQCRRCLDKHA
jgi:hypothetical protein